jgi:hypothetical protein
LGEVSYSAFTGNVAGPVSGHAIYELVAFATLVVASSLLAILLQTVSAVGA